MVARRDQGVGKPPKHIGMIAPAWGIARVLVVSGLVLSALLARSTPTYALLVFGSARRQRSGSPFVPLVGDQCIWETVRRDFNPVVRNAKPQSDESPDALRVAATNR